MQGHRTLDRPLTVWRIGDAAGLWPVWHAGGAMIFPGRWNESGEAVIYAAERYSLAMLENLLIGME